MPSTDSPSSRPLTVQVSPLGGAKGFCLTPNISLTLGNFSKKFSPPYTSPQLYKFPLLRGNSTSGLEVRAPRKKFFDKIMKTIPPGISTKVCTVIRGRRSCDPSTQIIRFSISFRDRGLFPNFWTAFFLPDLAFNISTLPW